MNQEIPLNLKMFTAVWQADFALFGNLKWHISSNGYAVRSTNDGGKVKLHSLIMSPEPKTDVDHINGDRLDNRRDNLRVVSRSINSMNKWSNRDFNSRFLGVFPRYIKEGWFVLMSTSQGQKYLGDYEDDQKAALAYDMGVRHYCTGDAKTNFSGDKSMSAREILMWNGQANPQSSQYKGVSYSGGDRVRWQAKLRHNGTIHKLGTFISEIEAAMAYDDAVMRIFPLDKANAKINFPRAA